MNKKLLMRSLIHALGAFAYIFLVVQFMNNIGPRIPDSLKFGPVIFGPVVFLLLFVFSAAMMGVLILGKPVLLYMENQKKESLALLGLTLGWLGLILLITISIILLLI